MKQSGGFLAEVKRRKVARVAVVYGAVAFAVVQVADVAFPRIPLPDWTVSLVVWLAILGFPIALVLAWAFDLTPDGVKRTPSESSSVAPEPGRWIAPRTAAMALGILALGVVGGWWAGQGRTPSESTPAALGVEPALPPSVAVLPFANMSGDIENEYFSDGLAEEVLNLLAKVEGLKVSARTSSFAYRGENSDIRAIGDALGVNNVLEGSVRKSGEQVRITAQLIQTSDGFHLWSETFDRELDDIFRIQEEIAEQIVRALRLELGIPVERAVARERPTADMDAYELFLQARHLFNQRGEGALNRSIDLYEEALARDSTFAEAHVGLAMTYAVLPGYDYSEMDYDPSARALEAARRGLELNPALALGHAVRGYLLSDDEEHSEAHAAFLRARELDPSDPTVLFWSALHELAAGRMSVARMQLEQAYELDPASGVVIGWLGNLQVVMGDVAAARRFYDRSLDLGWWPGALWPCLLALESAPWEEVQSRCAGDSGPTSILLEDIRQEIRNHDSSDSAKRALMAEAPSTAIFFASEDANGEAFFSALDSIVKTSKWQVWRPEASRMRQDPRFAEWVTASGLVAYWDEVGWPEFCSRAGSGEVSCR